MLLKELIRKAVSGGTYLNTSDFIRDAVKEKLERDGYFVSVPGGTSSDRREL